MSTDGFKKSLGLTIPAQFRFFRIPGQTPDPNKIKALKSLTAMPSRKMQMAASAHPCFTPERVVEGLGMGRGQEQSWSQHIAKAMSHPNELLMRQDIYSRMFEEKMDRSLRQVIFSRSLSLWREKGRLSKAVSVVRPGDLLKAGPFIGPRGGKWQDAKHTIAWGEGKPKYKVPSIEDLKGKGYSQGQAELIHRNISEKADTDSWSKDRVAKDKGKYPKLSDKIGKKKVEVFRVVPKGVDSINVGDYVFSSKKEAKSFRDEYGYVRGQPDIVSMKAGSSSFILPHKSDNELIFIGEDLKKSEPRGGTYVKRVPKPGGGYRYFYDEDKYNSHEGAHVSGGEAAKAAITKAVAGHVKGAGKDGCELAALKPLVKRYGSKMVGELLNQACAGGGLTYKNKRLFAKSEKFVLRSVS